MSAEADTLALFDSTVLDALLRSLVFEEPALVGASSFTIVAAFAMVSSPSVASGDWCRLSVESVEGRSGSDGEDPVDSSSGSSGGISFLITGPARLDRGPHRSAAPGGRSSCSRNCTNGPTSDRTNGGFSRPPRIRTKPGEPPARVGGRRRMEGRWGGSWRDDASDTER